MPRPMLALFLVLLLAAPSLADQVVTGTGDPSRDVADVQAAVDKGGTVKLLGRFDFGGEGRVKIRKNVRILGRRDGSDEPATVIRGGTWTLYSPLPIEGAPPAENGPIITVRDIHFDGARGTPLHFAHAGGLEIGGCLVTNVEPQGAGIKWEGGESQPLQAGIVVGNRLVYAKGMLKRAITGTVLIEGNRLEMINDHPEETAGYGVLADWTWGAELTIRDNEISRASRNGIEVLDNALDAHGKGSIRIRDNRIATDDEGIAYPNKFGPNGIVAGWYFDTSGGADFARNNRISITGNRIEGRGENSTGLQLYANDMVVACNDVVMAGGGARAAWSRPDRGGSSPTTGCAAGPITPYSAIPSRP